MRQQPKTQKIRKTENTEKHKNWGGGKQSNRKNVMRNTDEATTTENTQKRRADNRTEEVTRKGKFVGSSLVSDVIGGGGHTLPLPLHPNKGMQYL